MPFPHRANYVSELEGFEHYGEWVYRQIGCLGTRKFVNDLALVRNIRRCMERGDVLVLYPEARCANVGNSSLLPPSVAKLIRYLGVPVVTLNMRGNYLQSPIWNLKRRKGVRLEAKVRQLLTAQQSASLPLEKIQRVVQEALTYDEYAWQCHTGLTIDAPWRAEGLEHPLYQCAACGTEFHMASRGAELFCTVCGARWRMTEHGQLEGVNTPAFFPHVPDWYEWERRQVEEEIAWGAYKLDLRVRVQSLPNAVNFIELGEGRLCHDGTGFALTFTDYGAEKPETLRFPPRSTFSVHTEYDYQGQGECITLFTPDNTYFLYPLERGFCATKIQFAAEALWCRTAGEGKTNPAIGAGVQERLLLKSRRIFRGKPGRTKGWTGERVCTVMKRDARTVSFSPRPRCIHTSERQVGYLQVLKIGEIFRQKIHIGHCPLPVVQGLQTAGVRGEVKAELVGVQSLIGAAVGLVVFLPAILAVSRQGVAGIGQLGADLVGTAGNELALQQGQPAPCRQGAVKSDGGFPVRHRPVVDLHLGPGLVLDQKALQLSLRGADGAVNNAQHR